jgi:hypothetical protein
VNFIQNQQRILLASTAAYQNTRSFPLLFNPGPILKRRFISGTLVGWHSNFIKELPGNGGFARLARTSKHLDKAARFFNSFNEQCLDWSFVHGA